MKNENKDKFVGCTAENLKKILRSKTYEFNIDGKYLIDNGMEQGVLMGKVLKKTEEEWIKNNFKIITIIS